jgi:hypothetical protein
LRAGGRAQKNQGYGEIQIKQYSDGHTTFSACTPSVANYRLFAFNLKFDRSFYSKKNVQR